MSDQQVETTLELLGAPLGAAIGRLVITSESTKPFIVVQLLGATGLPQSFERKKDGPGSEAAVFVQFCTHNEQLLYDCPPLKEYMLPCKVEDAVRLALDALKRQGVQPQARVQVWEHQDELIPRRTLLGLFLPSR